jgi:hypothetical protein
MLMERHAAHGTHLYPSSTLFVPASWSMTTLRRQAELSDKGRREPSVEEDV